ncbi:origin recognition complex, subunit 5 [Baffinella frigidus]|nr:origin recognition complex, subunit 5 [Cryptophyta sp. CCMP2293]
MDAALLPVLLRIAQLSARNVCTILVSSAARQTFEPFLTARPALRLHFPPYSRIAIARILAHDASSNPARAEEYTEIAKVALNVFWGQCRALPELRQVAWQLCEAADHDPAVSSAAREKDSVKLFRALRPALRQASSSSSSSGPSAAQDAVTSAPEDPSSSSTAEGGASASGQTGPPRETRGGGLEELGLPLYSKHLLIAAFLASYSPPARDVATFSLLTTGPMRRKKRGGVHKVVPTGTKAQREGDLLNKPPGVFGLERLLAIFHTVNPNP